MTDRRFIATSIKIVENQEQKYSGMDTEHPYLYFSELCINLEFPVSTWNSRNYHVLVYIWNAFNELQFGATSLALIQDQYTVTHAAQFRSSAKPLLE